MATDSQFNTLVADAVTQHEAGHLAEAEAAYRAALAIAPSHAAVTHNLAVIAATRGRPEEAIGLFEQVIAREPSYVSAHYNRALALQTLRRTQDAVTGFARVCALEPGHYDAHRALGFLWLAQGDRGRSLDHFARTYELRRGDDRMDPEAKSLTHATRDKLQHDADQFRYLANRHRDRARFEGLARAYASIASDFPGRPARLTPAQRDVLGDDYNTAITISDAPELSDRAVSARPDADDLARRFRERPTGAVVVDELLTPRALVSLRRHLLESTIWHDFNHIDGFVASYLEDGLACPLILQIADELRATFPQLLGAHPLSQAWAFKGLHARSAVDVHADDAAISVNFWVTPTAANLDLGGGGLAVCRVPPPPDWEVRGYEADQGRIVAFLEQNAGDTLIAPYRENRAAIFESRLFHRSDRPNFDARYENHRINLTFLYGRHGP